MHCIGLEKYELFLPKLINKLNNFFTLLIMISSTWATKAYFEVKLLFNLGSVPLLACSLEISFYSNNSI